MKRVTSLARRCAVPLCLSIAAGLMVAAPAQAAPTWLAPVDVQGASSAYPGAALVDVDAAGNVTAVWANETTDDALLTSDHPVGGPWSAPAPLSALGVANDFDLAVGGSGDAVAAWIMPGLGGDEVEASHRAPGGSWSAPVAISNANDLDVRDVHVGMDGDGNALAVWDAVDNLGGSSIASVTAGRNAAWSGVVPISTGDFSAGQPDAAVAPDGAATVVWSQFNEDLGVYVVEAASRTSADGLFDSGVVISATDTDAAGPSVAVNAAGAVAVAWSQDVDASHNVLKAAIRAAGSSWGPPQQVSAAPDLTSEEDEANRPRLVVDGTGAPTVVWQQRVETLIGGGPDTDIERTAHAASATPGGTWSTPESFGDLSGRGYLELVVDATGTATAAWLADGRPALLSRRPAGGAWSAPLELETRTDVGTSSVAVAADPVGNVVAVWAVDTDADDSQGLLRARAYDVDGPLVNALSVPGSGTAGTPVAYSVAAVDAWSAVSSTSWSFGDGTAASGANVSHTYAGAGTYAVSVTVTDAVGNVRTRTGSTVVAAAPVITPPAVTPKPQLTGVKLTKKTIHVVKSDEKPRATKLKLTLNTDAKVKVVLKRTKKLHGKTVKATLTTALKKGAATIKLTSKVGSKRLPPGTYKVKVTGKNAVGTGVAVVVRLKILS